MSSTTSAAPRFWEVARRPRWIAALILVLAVASAFAALGRWQLERSIQLDTGTSIDTETPVALDSVAEPGVRMTADAYARIVTVSGSFDPDGYLILHGRLQREEPGYWVVGRLAVDDPADASLAVAIGWAETEADATRAIDELATGAAAGSLDLRGRYLPTEDPRFENIVNGERSALVVGELINLWPDFSGEVYAGYLILGETALADVGAGTQLLTAIDAPPPLPEQQVNLLNLFYALEWVIFGGFALYLWWRLVKDEVEKETEEARAASVAAAVTASGEPPASALAAESPQTPAVD